MSLLYGYQSYRSRRDAEQMSEKLDATRMQALRELELLKEAQSKNQNLLGQVKENIKLTPDEAKIQQDVVVLQKSLDDIHSDLAGIHKSVDTINTALMATPEKAITIPLMQKDIDNLKLETQRDLDSIHAEMVRSNDLNKWIIGLIVAAVLGTTLNSFLQSRKPAKEPSDS